MQLTPSSTPRHRRPPHPAPRWPCSTPPRGGTHVAHTVRNALSEEGAGGSGETQSSPGGDTLSGASIHPSPGRGGPPRLAHGGGR